MSLKSITRLAPYGASGPLYGFEHGAAATTIAITAMFLNLGNAAPLTPMSGTGTSAVTEQFSNPVLDITPHVLDGPLHTVSGETPGAVMTAKTATTFGFVDIAQVLTDAATIAVDASKSRYIDATLTLTGNHMLGNPTGMLCNGQMLSIEVTNTGSYNLTYDTAFEFANGLAEPTITAGSGKVSYLGFKYYASTGKWNYIAEALAD